MTRFGGAQFGQFRDLSDYMAAEEAFQAQKRKAELDEQMRLEDIGIKRKLAEAKLSGQVSDGNVPATIQIANEMQKAKAAGDVERFNLLNQVHKTMDRGVYVDPSTGRAQLMPGYGQTMGELSGYKASGARQAQKTVDLGMNPKIKAAEFSSEEQAKSAANWPRVEAKSQEIENLLTKIETHPGLEAAVGMPTLTGGQIPFIGAIPGSKAADFGALLDQLGGKQFLEAYESLKGSGAISEVEGLKATNAIARMQTSQSEKAFKEAVQEFKDIVVNARERAKQKAGIVDIPPLDEQELNAPIGIKIDAPPPQVRPLSKYEQGEADFNMRKYGNMKNKSDEELMKILMGK